MAVVLPSCAPEGGRPSTALVSEMPVVTDPITQETLNFTLSFITGADGQLIDGTTQKPIGLYEVEGGPSFYAIQEDMDPLLLAGTTSTMELYRLLDLSNLQNTLTQLPKAVLVYDASGSIAGLLVAPVLNYGISGQMQLQMEGTGRLIALQTLAAAATIESLPALPMLAQAPTVVPVEQMPFAEPVPTAGPNQQIDKPSTEGMAVDHEAPSAVQSMPVGSGIEVPTFLTADIVIGEEVLGLTDNVPAEYSEYEGLFRKAYEQANANPHLYFTESMRDPEVISVIEKHGFSYQELVEKGVIDGGILVIEGRGLNLYQEVIQYGLILDAYAQMGDDPDLVRLQNEKSSYYLVTAGMEGNRGHSSEALIIYLRSIQDIAGVGVMVDWTNSAWQQVMTELHTMYTRAVQISDMANWTMNLTYEEFVSSPHREAAESLFAREIQEHWFSPRLSFDIVEHNTHGLIALRTLLGQ